MKHVRLATYRIKKGTFDEVVKIATEPGAISDIYQGIDGFVQFGVADLGDGTFASMTLWESRESAEKAAEAAQTWVSGNLTDRVELTTNAVGDLGHLVP